MSTRSPIAASAVPRLIAVVVLPTPPFWLARTRTRMALASVTLGTPGGGRAVTRIRRAVACVRLGRDANRNLGSRAASVNSASAACPLGKTPIAPRSRYFSAKDDQRDERRERAGADGVDRLVEMGGEMLDAFRVNLRRRPCFT